MAADSTSTAMAMMASSSSLYLGSSLPSPSMSPFHLLLQQQPHQMEMEMLSFQSMDSPAAPTFPQPPNAASMPMLLPPSSSSSSSPSPSPPPSSSPAFRKYEFVTGSPADWTDQEVAVLNDGLLRYAHEPNITKYIKIAAMLPTKTIRDVALRCWWPTGKEGKRGKPDEVYMGKTTRGLKENMVSATLPATFQIQSPNNMVSFSISMHHQGQNTLIRKEVHVLDSATRHLLEENNQLLSQIAENIETFKMVENMDLFLRTNNNIRTVLKRMNETPGIMGQMPPLPIPVNEGSLNSLLQMDRMVGAYGVP